MPRPTEHPYLTGNYAPVPDETSITGLHVDGAIPCGLDGRYLQIGPNPIGNPARPYVWSAADAMVHAVTIRPGRAPSYRNRWVNTARASQLLGTEPAPGEEPGAADLADAMVVAVGDRVLALAANEGYELGADLETRRRVRIPRELSDESAGADRPRSRYVYSRSRIGEMPFDGTEIRKYDIATGSMQRTDFGTGRHPGELVFVSDPRRRDREDGGWLVGFVHDDHTALAELVVLDAMDFASPAIATVHLTRRVPYGLHATWAPSRSTPKERS